MAKKQKKDKLKDVPDLGGKFLGVEDDTPKVEATFQVQGVLFPLDKNSKENAEFLRAICLGNIFDLIESYTKLRGEIAEIEDQLSPVLRERYRLETLDNILSVLSEMRESVLLTMSAEDPTMYIESLEEIRKQTLHSMENYNILIEQKEKDYQIKTDPQTGKKYALQFKSSPSGYSVNALQELRKISQRPGVSQIKIPKDLMDTQTHSVGDVLEYITDPKKREKIRKLQTEGKLLAGTLEGLSGGTAYLKSFTIALAHTLNEQSKYYKTEEDYSGVPTSLIPSIFGEKVEVQKNPVSIVLKDKTDPTKKEERKIPYILVSYEEIASKMRGKGKKRGGKDSEYIREYIDKLSGKQYLLDGGRGAILGIPFLTKTMTIYREDTGEEVGCLLSLSPQFSRTIRGYTGLRADTLQLIGGGRQKDITMCLLDYLLYVRGTDKGNVWKKNKGELLSRIGGGKTYSGRPGKREKDFREAIQKVKDSGLIIDYREETAHSGETISVFTYNPNYSKEGDGETPDVQNGE